MFLHLWYFGCQFLCSFDFLVCWLVDVVNTGQGYKKKNQIEIPIFTFAGRTSHELHTSRLAVPFHAVKCLLFAKCAICG